MDPTPWLWALCIALVVAGLLGSVLPVLPGAPLVWLGLLCGAAADRFAVVGVGALALLGALALATYGVDLLASSLGAQRSGASRKAVVGAALGMLVGLFFGLPGLLLGPFLGAAIGEWIARRDLRQAGRAGVGTWLGMLLGAGAKLAIELAMIGIFAWIRFG